MRLAGLLLLPLLLIAPALAPAGDLDDFYERHQALVRSLFERLDLDTPGLEDARARYEANDLPGACSALIDYYRRSPWVGRVQRVMNDPAFVLDQADDVLRDVFHLLNIEALNPRRPDGGLDWRYRGPNDDREWTLTLNWHLFFQALVGADELTGDPSYARAFGALVSDWVLANPVPEGAPQGEIWRSLETAMRMARSWPRSFYGFVASPEVPSSAKILMLSSIPDHARILMRHHSHQGNHVLIEMAGLAYAAVAWSEFADSDRWLRYALEIAEGEMRRQVYPDGVQKELSNHYQVETTHYFERIVEAARLGGAGMSPAFEERLEAMWDYLARVAKPSGYGPLNNDADVENNAWRVLGALETYGREDWRYIATGGAEGVAPAGSASSHYPWAGHVILRSGWEPDALWSLFDAGPSGMAHAHYDRLHLSVSAFGRDFLVDNGRYHHKVDALREYFKGPRGHNVILVDGRRQPLRPRVRGGPHDDHVVLHEAFDFAAGSVGFEDVDPRLRHHRAVLRYRDRYWLVVDLVLGFGSHDVEALWHFHPDCTVVADGASVKTADEETANLTILPVGDVDWDLEVVSGQTEPVVQGWFSERYNHKLTAAAAVYQARTDGPTMFAWVIAPRRQGPAILPTVERLPSAAGTMRLRIDGTEIAVRLYGESPLELSDGWRVAGELAILDGSRRLYPER